MINVIANPKLVQTLLVFREHFFWMAKMAFLAKIHDLKKTLSMAGPICTSLRFNVTIYNIYGYILIRKKTDIVLV